jgi:hypothetical protein
MAGADQLFSNDPDTPARHGRVSFAYLAPIGLVDLDPLITKTESPHETRAVL